MRPTFHETTLGKKLLTKTEKVNYSLRLHGLSKMIVCDRDPRFTADFFKEIFGRLRVELKFSTAQHPQTDGQTERTHRTIGQNSSVYGFAAVWVCLQRHDAWINAKLTLFLELWSASTVCWRHFPQCGKAFNKFRCLDKKRSIDVAKDCFQEAMFDRQLPQIDTGRSVVLRPVSAF